MRETAPQASTEYYYDRSACQILLGKTALNAHIEMGGHPLDIVSIDRALRDTSIELPERRAPTDKKVTKEEILTSLKWLYSILEPPEEPKKKLINETIIARAHWLGLIAGSLDQIQNRFGNTSNLYKELHAKGAHIKHPELDPAKAMEYLQELFVKKGRMPKAKELDEEAANDPAKPRYSTLRTRLVGGLSNLGLEEGFELAKDSTPAELIRWGVNYRRTNGSLPSQKIIDLMSAVGKSVSATTIANSFSGSLVDFNSIVESAFESWENTAAKKKDDLIKAVESGRLPGGLLYDSRDEKLIITRSARYEILNRLFPDAHYRAKLAWAMNDYSDPRFVNGLKRLNHNIDVKVISEISQDLGYTPDMWRMDTKDLNLINAIELRLDQLRGPLSSDDYEKFTATSLLVVDFMEINELSDIKAQHLRFLQNKGRLSRGDRFDHLFGNSYYFRMLTRAMAQVKHKERHEIEDWLEGEMAKDLQKTTLPSELFLNIYVSSKNKTLGNEQAANYIRAVVHKEQPPKLLVRNTPFVFQKKEIPRSEKLTRYARWHFARTFFSGVGLADIDPAEIVIISSLSRTRTFAEEVVNKTLQRGVHCNIARVEAFALVMGLHSYVSPPVEQYVNSLRLPARRIRHKKSAKKSF